MIVGLLTAAAIVAALFAHFEFSKRSIANIRRCRGFVEGFHAAAKPLLEDDETPEDTVHKIAFLNREIARRGAAWSFFHFVVSGDLSEPRSDEELRQLEMEHAFLDRRPELKRAYYQALSNAILAIVFQSPILKPLISMWLSSGVAIDDETLEGREPRNESVVIGFKKYLEPCAV